jgi:phage-related protein
MSFKAEKNLLRNFLTALLNSLDLKMRVKALGSIDILAEFGNALRKPYSKAVHDGLFELRIKFAKDITRIFYFF